MFGYLILFSIIILSFVVILLSLIIMAGIVGLDERQKERQKEILKTLKEEKSCNKN